MFRLLGKIPEKPIVALSGGIDSMVLLDFMVRGKRKVSAAYFNHGTKYGAMCEGFLIEHCKKIGVELFLGKISVDYTEKQNSDGGLENFWRTHRYNFLNSFEGNVMTAHHLNDVAEWWVFSSLHGNGKMIPYSNKNIIRPFLMVDKSQIKQWAEKHNVAYIDDPSNMDTKFRRNFIRHDLMPLALQVNPGLLTTLRKKYQNDISV